MQLEDALLYGLNKETLKKLQSKKRKTLEEKIILINTYIEILEYDAAKKLLKLVELTLKSLKKKPLNLLILTFLSNKLLLVKSNFSSILKNIDTFELTNYEELKAREKTFLILILFVKAEALFRLGNYSHSQEILSSITSITSKKEIEKISLTKEVITGLNNRISFMNYYYLGEIDKARDAVYSGLEIYTKTNNPIYLAYFYNFKGILSSLKGDYFIALESFTKCISFFESIGESTDQYSIKYTAGIYNNISNLLKDQGRLKEAIDITNSVLQLYEQNNISIEMANCYAALGIYYRELRDFEIAEAYLFKAYNLRKKINDSVEISDSLLNICILEEMTGRLTPNTICLKEFPNNSESKIVLANKLIIQGIFDFSQKKYRQALENLDKAFDIQGIEFSNRLVILDYKADIFLENSDFKNFSEFLKIWKAIASENNLLPSLFKANLIDFRFELLFLNFESAENSLREAQELASNYSIGAQKLVEENIKLFNKRKLIMSETDESIFTSKTKEQELLELKIYIKEISSLISQFQDVTNLDT